MNNGWPVIRPSRHGKADLISVMIILTNIPDLVSICFYFKLWKHLSNSIEPVAAAEGNAQDEAEGEAGGAFPADIPVAWPIQEMENDSAENGHVEDPPNDENTQRLKRVLRSLRYHSMTCLLDLLFAVVPQIPKKKGMVVVVHFYSLLVAYWIPLFVIKTNFKQMDSNVVGILKKLMRCNAFSST